MHKIPILDDDTSITFTNEQGEPIAEVDILQIDTLLSAAFAHQGDKLEDREKRVNIFAAKLSLLLQRKVSPATASLVMAQARKRFEELKKKFSDTLTLLNSTPSIPAEPTPDFSASSTMTSTDSRPSGNSDHAATPPSSRPSEPIV